MAWAPLLTVIAGRADLEAMPAKLPGHALNNVGMPCFPALVATPGADIEGMVLRAPPQAAAARLAFFAEGLGHHARPVSLADGSAALAFVVAQTDTVQAEDATWSAAAWESRWGALALDASAEAMRYFGRIDATGLAWRMSMILSRAGSRRAAADGAPATLRSATPASEVACLARHTPHEGYFLTREYTLRYPGFDGTMSPPLRREVFVAADAALVLPYDPRRDRVLLVEQFRMGLYARGDPRPWMLEPVAGRIDAGETPEAAARRECMEEAGLELERMEFIAGHYSSPGCSTEYFYLYLGLCDLRDEGQGHGGLESEHEDIRTHVISFDRAMELLATGEADNGPLVLSLVWLSRERARLRASA